MPDSLISEVLSWDYDFTSKAAYNEQDGEYLVVWNTFDIRYALTDPKFFGPVWGQRIKENGSRIGQPFPILSAGVLADVAYNTKTHEYLVVAEQWFNIVGQRLDGSGGKIGSQALLMPSTRYPRLAVNSLKGNYVLAAWWQNLANTPGLPGTRLRTALLGADGAVLGVNTVEEWAQATDQVDKFALAFAPLEAPDPTNGKNPTPGGRYLLTSGMGPQSLRLLDATGKALNTVFDQYHNTWYPNIPYIQSGMVKPWGIDVAFGYLGSSPVFFFVWADNGNHMYSGHQWTGVKGGTLSAARTCYYVTEPQQGDAFPLSWIVSHVYVHPAEWRPKVAYNPQAKLFVVAWRETPDSGAAPVDVTINHIRFNTSSGYKIPPSTNTVVSAVEANGNPIFPFVAASTNTTGNLVGYLDFRWWVGRTYGNFVDAATRKITSF
jgi:hypothetical protein